ncbi:hypothetical protein DFH11DRAFT_1579897 [Phellopilus nigrolimitatus]|nr:hypothetical protein DFH11DRAFT_1579897 [Phellopilus nigrolimitatus]
MSTTDLASLSIFPATREQTIQTRKNSYPHWGRGLTQDQYLAREARLGIFEHATNETPLTIWVLVPRDDPTTLEFKCSCETYRRKALTRLSNSSVPENVIAYGIASVFCPPINRGKGYARHMMHLLHWVLAPRTLLPRFPASWGPPPEEFPGYNDARFSVLYSDIGPQFYRSTGPDEHEEGWVVRDAMSTIWDVPKDPDVSSADLQNADKDLKVEWLNDEACTSVWAADAMLIRADLAASSPDKHTRFTFFPDEGVGAFLARRTVFFIPGQSYSMPEKWGVVLRAGPDDSNAPKTFATWTLDVRPPPSTLIATRMFPRIVACMLQAARESDMERVEVWNLPTELKVIAERLGGKTSERDEHLNAFKWYGPEKNEDLKWAFNEKFCWC